MPIRALVAMGRKGDRLCRVALKCMKTERPCQALTPDLCHFNLKEGREPVRAHTLEPIRA